MWAPSLVLILASVAWADDTTQSPLTWYTPSSTNTVTCAPATFAWVYSGTVPTMSISITNLGVNETDPPSVSTFVRRATPPPAVAAIVADSLSSYSGSYTWEKVLVPQGWYKLIASVGQQPYETTDFYVTGGSDTSCLPNAPTTTSAPNTSTATPTTTQQSTTSGGTPATLPPVLSSSPKKVNKGAIAGGVVGGLAVLAAVAAALLFLGVCAFGRKKPAYSTRGDSSSNPFATFKWDRKQSAKKTPKSAKWGGLGSFDGSAGNRDIIDVPEAAQPKDRSHSFGAIAAPVSGLTSRSEEFLAEKYRNATQYEQRDSVQTTSTAPPASSPTYDFDYEFGHETRHAAYPPTSPPADRAPSRSSSFASTILTNMNPFSPASSVPSLVLGGVSSEGIEHSNSTSTDRRSSLGASPSTRKTPRKPAPVYEPSVVDIPLDGTPATPHIAPTQVQPKRKSLNGKSHYESRHGNNNEHELRHQNSFGDGRQMHILIPDMPLPQEN